MTKRDMVPDLVCAGRPVDDRGQVVGDVCGRRLRPLLGDAVLWDDQVHAREELNLIWRARAGGWAVSDPRPDGSRDVMCPRCRRPDPAIARGLSQVGTSPHVGGAG